MMDVLLETVSWWEEVWSCFHSGIFGCGSAALGLLSLFTLTVSYCVLFCHQCKLNACDAGSAVPCGLYSLIGNLCNAAGSVLSHQLPFQIITAFFLVVLDVLLLLSTALPLCWWHHSRTGRRVRMMSRRRRQNSLAVCLLFGMGGYVYIGQVKHHSQLLTDRSVSSRRLLGTFLHDRIKLIGYVLGLLSFAISWTSRFPFFFKANRGEMSNPLHVSSRVLSTLAGAFYASAILLFDTQLEFVVRALPWILSGACCAILDVSILTISCYRIHYKHQSVRTLGSETVSLLKSHCSASGQNRPKDKPVRKHRLSSQRSSSSKTTETGRYMDVNLQPVRKVCLKEVRITRDGSADNQPLKRSVKVVRVDECYSSGSTTDSSSSLSSELEWDFEEATPPWSSQSNNQPLTEAFPLQEWPTDQRLKCNRSDFRACFCNSGDLEERMVSSSTNANLNLSDAVK
ncbi:transmembrane protein 44 [Hoplias malabaricus]|uniref:transmembrane protein 44 n=1 Tax=Hoplias malabaricus TaxID=27720 RepID=UPI00346208D5